MRGVIGVDKPPGPTSFDVVRAVRRAFRTRKVGHTGTLDPFASGVLPVCVGGATGLVPWLQAGDKVYLATVRFGVGTDTLDPTGQVVARSVVPAAGLDPSAVAAAAACLVGEIEQVPPAFSAIKVDGRRAYELSREGRPPELDARTVRVDSVSVLGVDGADVQLRVRCGPGTYIRAMARDLGQALELPAHLTSLRRTLSGGLEITDCVTLERLAEEPPPALLPIEAAVAFLPAVTLEGDAAVGVAFGRVPPAASIPADLAEGAPCRLLDSSGMLLAVATVLEAHWRLRRVFVTPEGPASDQGTNL